jgi:hypothetical protein
MYPSSTPPLDRGHCPRHFAGVEEGFNKFEVVYRYTNVCDSTSVQFKGPDPLKFPETQTINLFLFFDSINLGLDVVIGYGIHVSHKDKIRIRTHLFGFSCVYTGKMKKVCLVVVYVVYLFMYLVINTFKAFRLQ